MNTIFLFLQLLYIVNGYKILLLVPMNGPSHWNYLKNFIRELNSRGHDVTAITSQAMEGYNSTKYREVLIDPPLNLRTISKLYCFKLMSIIIDSFFFLYSAI